MDNVKSIFASKTFWANLLGGITAPWLAYLGGQIPKEAAIAATTASVVNIGLRYVTTQPVSLTGK